ncbi:MAG: methionyl-tRNA formyltransferase [Candidatus Cloacimonetes bacterium]|nr:methionyl-tRNA formyltransferase [Candidatus Cloacimonadota bacterium]
MNVLFYGDGPWAHLSLKKLSSLQNVLIKGVVLRHETQDPELKKIADSIGLSTHVEKNVNSKGFIEFSKSLKLDLSISMSFNQIIKKELRGTNKLGFINCHAGKLPYYRGRNILNWVLINDEKEFGVTVHYIDDGIDTGDIICQEAVPIVDEDNYSTLLDKAIAKCPDVLLDAVNRIANNNVNPIRQNHLSGSYFSYRREGDEIIDWNWNSRRIFNFIRALVKPSPGAQTSLGGKRIYIWESEETSFKNYISTCGEIIKRDEDGVYVKTGDNVIKITKVSYETKGEYFIPKFRTGERFSSANFIK